MSFTKIVEKLGPPSKPSAMLNRSNIPPGLKDAIEGGFAGAYGDGILSIWGDREQLASLGGWEAYLPPGSFVFATTAFGVCAIWGGGRIWILDPQYGQIVESEMEIGECLEVLARDKWLHAELFHRWKANAVAPLGPFEVLTTVPLLALGGSWESPLHPEPLEVFLGMTAGLFDPEGSSPAEVRRLD